MNAEWYYAKNKQKVGPVTEAHVQELVRSGELSRTDMVWKQGMAKWMQAGQVEGLLDTLAPTPPRSRTTKKSFLLPIRCCCQ